MRLTASGPGLRAGILFRGLGGQQRLRHARFLGLTALFFLHCFRPVADERLIWLVRADSNHAMYKAVNDLDS